MNWLRNTKAGSYIVEAVIVVPIFIMAVVMLISIIPIIGTCENITFAAADEVHLECAKTAFRKNLLVLPAAVDTRVSRENLRISDYKTTGYRYLYSKKDIDNLITLKFTAVFSEKNPLGLFSTVCFDGTVTARAFTGSLQKEPPAERKDFEEEKESHKVYIFPEWGKRHHSKNCTYVRANCYMTPLTESVKDSYKPCPLCNAKSAQAGTTVFCFAASGEDYHLSGCKTVDRYYIEIEKEEAEEKGYSPCSKCGGG